MARSMVIRVVGGQPFSLGRPVQLIVGRQETKLASASAQRLHIIEGGGQLYGIVAAQDVFENQMGGQVNDQFSQGQDMVLPLYDVAAEFPHASIQLEIRDAA